jgi:membrane protease subunit (stomatin/prohibitin family)
MEAMKNGIGSGVSGASVLGDLAGLGIGLGAMGGVIDMTKNAMSPVMGEATQMGQNIVTTATPVDTWDCACGTKGITSKFCPECGTKRPEIKKTWDCPNCGTKDIASKFCPECGTKREG